METDIIARGYELAGAGWDLEQIRLKLKREGYANVDAHLSSRKLRAELKKILSSKST